MCYKIQNQEIFDYVEQANEIKQFILSKNEKKVVK